MSQKKTTAAAKSTNAKRANSSDATGSTKPPLREIIYLDVPRITSYLSQLQGGLEEYRELMKTASQYESGSNVGFSFGGGVIPAALNVNPTGTSSSDAATELSRRTAHHAALTALETLLGEQDLIGATGSGRPFAKHSGYPMFMDYKYLANKFRNVADLLEGLAKVTAFQKAGPAGVDLETASDKIRIDTFNAAKSNVKRQRAIANQTQMMYDGYARVFDESAEQITIYYHEAPIAGALDPQHMLTSTALIFANYGIPTRAQVTTLALTLEGKTDHEQLIAPDQLPEGKGRGVGYAAAFLTQTYTVVRDSLGDTEATPVLPIAVYIELENQAAK